MHMEDAMTLSNANPRSGGVSVVLVGIDFSELSRDALGVGQSIAANAAGELHLVHVLPLPAADSVVATRSTRELRYAELANEVQAKLEELVAAPAANIRRISLHVRVGKPDVEIAQLASDLGADIIVVGSHGLTGIARLVLGSVSESLVRRAPCPVLAYRPKAAPAWPEIEPPCAECVAVQKETNRAKLWCERHATHHPRAHTYSEIPPSFAMGSQSFR
jgi:nucleotide-binding universal stress UspA family protein